MSISFKDQVVIVTGAGAGLGRSHALDFARRGAKVVVNDFGGATDGTGGSTAASEAVVAEIKAAGGEAIANGADVSDEAQVKAMVDQAMAEWGRVDVVVANAGILRDKTFIKMEMDDFRKVLDVHLMGTVHCAKAVWVINHRNRANKHCKAEYSLSNSDDMNRELFLKADAVVYVGFTY